MVSSVLIYLGLLALTATPSLTAPTGPPSVVLRAAKLCDDASLSWDEKGDAGCPICRHPEEMPLDVFRQRCVLQNPAITHPKFDHVWRRDAGKVAPETYLAGEYILSEDFKDPGVLNSAHARAGLMWRRDAEKTADELPPKAAHSLPDDPFPLPIEPYRLPRPKKPLPRPVLTGPVLPSYPIEDPPSDQIARIPKDDRTFNYKERRGVEEDVYLGVPLDGETLASPFKRRPRSYTLEADQLLAQTSSAPKDMVVNDVMIHHPVSSIFRRRGRLANPAGYDNDDNADDNTHTTVPVESIHDSGPTTGLQYSQNHFVVVHHPVGGIYRRSQSKWTQNKHDIDSIQGRPAGPLNKDMRDTDNTVRKLALDIYRRHHLTSPTTGSDKYVLESDRMFHHDHEAVISPNIIESKPTPKHSKHLQGDVTITRLNRTRSNDAATVLKPQDLRNGIEKRGANSVPPPEFFENHSWPFGSVGPEIPDEPFDPILEDRSPKHNKDGEQQKKQEEKEETEKSGDTEHEPQIVNTRPNGLNLQFIPAIVHKPANEVSRRDSSALNWDDYRKENSVVAGTQPSSGIQLGVARFDPHDSSVFGGNTRRWDLPTTKENPNKSAEVEATVAAPDVGIPNTNLNAPLPTQQAGQPTDKQTIHVKWPQGANSHPIASGVFHDDPVIGRRAAKKDKESHRHKDPDLLDVTDRYTARMFALANNVYRRDEKDVVEDLVAYTHETNNHPDGPRDIWKDANNSERRDTDGPVEKLLDSSATEAKPLLAMLPNKPNSHDAAVPNHSSEQYSGVLPREPRKHKDNDESKDSQEPEKARPKAVMLKPADAVHKVQGEESKM
ncbi:uncharacterized protein K460DRAFT_420096 [Cucurbitaria berberidis CBS 394.84]|uniref:Uncharacterized protein n=1 Tax=Cucurbitaria berberidis CBS 394.84 TaxID=1168544 RepID=A0A9P4L5A8_9PLEO|nr:uncharacterized protein K460DRAFT_420096 [Cucurbitaria berberidis CBS 394.84]KAF1842152.1 hypothetical protein K460DRAFT_420096 [Cucurbitaria berberidis CBS 394.84]